MVFRILCIYEIVYSSLCFFPLSPGPIIVGTFVGGILFSHSILMITWLHAARNAHPARAKDRAL